MSPIPVWTELDMSGATGYVLMGGVAEPITVAVITYTAPDVPPSVVTKCDAPPSVVTECSVPPQVWTEENFT